MKKNGTPARQAAIHRATKETDISVEWALDGFKPEGLQEIFFDDDTFTYNPKRMAEMAAAFKPLKFQWSSTSRLASRITRGGVPATRNTGRRKVANERS